MLRKLLLCAIPGVALTLGALVYTSASASSVPVSKVRVVKDAAVVPKKLPPFRVNLVNRVDYINRLNVVNKITLVDRITRIDRIDRVNLVDRISRVTCPDLVPKVDTGVIFK